MKLEDIVCDLEYSKKLRELGLNRKSLFRYNCITDELYCVIDDDVNWKQLVSPQAYTVAELGEMMTVYINNQKVEYARNGFDYICCLRGVKATYDKKEANTRAMFLIWCIENKHVNVENLNK